MQFKNELEFEDALVDKLKMNGWSDHVISYPTENELEANWRNILFKKNNRIHNGLNNVPLTDSEMEQILNTVHLLKSPVDAHTMLMGKTISIRRDAELDSVNYKKKIDLTIYEPENIARNSEVYQIVRQAKFDKTGTMDRNRRGDVTLLINGLPLIHIELKKEGVALEEAIQQIQKYTKEGKFRGMFSFVQLFVVMTPTEMKYFANPGTWENFNKDYFFSWTNIHNEPINSWEDVAIQFLSIPKVHEMVGYYTIANTFTDSLMVMRSYQHHAVESILEIVRNHDWNIENQRGGYIAHATGSGKTLSSFKAAQLILDQKKADKVVFLMDRIELGSQSLKEYRGFAGESKSVNNKDSDIKETEDTRRLKRFLLSDDVRDSFIVTSIQKMSRIKEGENRLHTKEIEKLNTKRIVFIIDEAHRSTFGTMLLTIKRTFPKGLFFGFTGTPIREINAKNSCTTLDIFGNELASYNVAQAIADHNVLGFHVEQIKTFEDSEVREAVALHEAKVSSVEEIETEQQQAIYERFNDESLIKMVTSVDKDGNVIKGIEDYIPNTQYTRTSLEVPSEHQKTVVQDILKNWKRLSRQGNFHALFATSSIPEAIEYYRLLKEEISSRNMLLHITCQFSTQENEGNTEKNGVSYPFGFKNDAIKEILLDYEKMFGCSFTQETYKDFKEDVANRLAHKSSYQHIEGNKEKQLDLLIVVDQMLTGYDSKWINTLYLDKVLEYEKVIQAFARTNRLCHGANKPYGIIRYYRKPNTMEVNIHEAFKEYAKTDIDSIFVDKLAQQISSMNAKYQSIHAIFQLENISNFEHLPKSIELIRKFSKEFNELRAIKIAAELQGFSWDKKEYSFTNADGTEDKVILAFDEVLYLALEARYNEIQRNGGGGTTPSWETPFDLKGYAIEHSKMIDSDYFEKNFQQLLKIRKNPLFTNESVKNILQELHKHYTILTVKQQEIAKSIENKILDGTFHEVQGNTFMDYIQNIEQTEENQLLHIVSKEFSFNFEQENLLKKLRKMGFNENTYRSNGYFDQLKDAIPRNKFSGFAYFDAIEALKKYVLYGEWKPDGE